jgi:hypothetical protein
MPETQTTAGPERKINAAATLRIVHKLLVASTFIYAIFGELFGPVQHRHLKLYQVVLMTVAVGTLGLVLVVKTQMVDPAARTLASSPGDTDAHTRWRAGNLAVMAMSEAVVLYGFVLRIIGGTLSQALPFYVAGLLMLLLMQPRRV